MKQVEYAACGHIGSADDNVQTVMKNTVMSLCPNCLAVQSPDELIIGYPCGYRTQYGKNIVASVKEIKGDKVIVATRHFQPGSMNYQEWTVSKNDFKKKGDLWCADPFGTIQ